MLYSAFISVSWSANFFTIFFISNNLGLVKDYKILRGTTVDSKTVSTRVLQNFPIKRELNYKTNAWVDLGVFTTRYIKRVSRDKRIFYGPVRPRWFRWRDLEINGEMGNWKWRPW